jgi:hypothetical protein
VAETPAINRALAPSVASSRPALLSFGFLGANEPGVGDLHQHFAIFLRRALRQSPALGGIIAEFLGARFGIVFFIIIHLLSHIAAVPCCLFQMATDGTYAKFRFKFMRLVERFPPGPVRIV